MRHGIITLSNAITQNVTQLSQLGTTWQYFVGDCQVLGEDDACDGDRVELEVLHGSIWVRYVNEVGGTGQEGVVESLVWKVMMGWDRLYLFH